MAKAKTLVSYYLLENGFRVIRVYKEQHFAQADRDLAMLQEHSGEKEWKLIDSELYDPNEPV